MFSLVSLLPTSIFSDELNLSNNYEINCSLHIKSRLLLVKQFAKAFTPTTINGGFTIRFAGWVTQTHPNPLSHHRHHHNHQPAKLHL
jgi:hypothetical protein